MKTDPISAEDYLRNEMSKANPQHGLSLTNLLTALSSFINRNILMKWKWKRTE